MKKLTILALVLAMAFLFVGCTLPWTTPEEEVPVEPVEPVKVVEVTADLVEDVITWSIKNICPDGFTYDYTILFTVSDTDARSRLELDAITGYNLSPTVNQGGTVVVLAEFNADFLVDTFVSTTKVMN